MSRNRVIRACCCLILVFLLGSMNGLAQSAIKTGDYVEFGSYLSAPILWRVMSADGDQAVIWSEYVLCAKCFDASESGVLGKGNTQVEQWGSNLWSNSNIREWLNSVGKVNWSTHPPTTGALQGKNNYENESGFLTGFSKVERDRIVPTDRTVIGYYFHRKIETTKDLVFLPFYEEVGNDGIWGLNDDNRLRRPSKSAAARNKAMAIMLKDGYGYQYFLQTLDDYDKCTVRAVTFEGLNSDQYGAGNSNVGIAPVMQISFHDPKSGEGSKERPWRF